MGPYSLAPTLPVAGRGRTAISWTGALEARFLKALQQAGGVWVSESDISNVASRCMLPDGRAWPCTRRFCSFSWREGAVGRASGRLQRPGQAR